MKHVMVRSVSLQWRKGIPGEAGSSVMISMSVYERELPLVSGCTEINDGGSSILPRVSLEICTYRWPILGPSTVEG